MFYFLQSFEYFQNKNVKFIFKIRQFPTWERFYLGKLFKTFFKLIFILYFTFNLINCLNIILPNKVVFEKNINNPSLIKSIVSKVMIFNVFPGKDKNLISKNISNQTLLGNKTFQNNVKIKNFKSKIDIFYLNLNKKDLDFILQEFIIKIFYPIFIYCIFSIIKVNNFFKLFS